jgi:ketosteroid isomerase-like protein
MGMKRSSGGRTRRSTAATSRRSSASSRATRSGTAPKRGSAALRRSATWSTSCVRHPVAREDIELHDVLANDEHAVALQVTQAERGGRMLSDRVVYVFHLRNGKIAEAWFNGDPRVQDDFWA